MTTAARPTFDPARGGRGKGENDLSALSKQYSSRDLPSHTKLKYRESGQSSVDDLREKDYRRELEEKERSVKEKRDKRSFTENPSLPPSNDSSTPSLSAIAGTRRPHPSSPPSSDTKRSRSDQQPATLDADDNIDDDDDDEDDDSDDDDTADLLRELQKIKKERAEEQARKEKERKEEEERIRKENLLKGNPLLNQDKGSFKVKKRWDDDVVFKNCARTEQKEGQHFINDTIRSEFHRKFMDKYVK